MKLVTALYCLPILAAAAADVLPWRFDEPPNEPYSPQEAIQHMKVPEGFRLELVASEPDIVNPIAMRFDDRGRIFITESIEYPRKPAGPGRDRLKILEDTDDDGRADKVTIFLDGLNIPTGVAVGYGGVWVLNAPDLLFVRDRDNKREVVVTGFGRTDTHELPNSLTWGPDGWLYGLNGVFNQCAVRSNNGKEYKFNCALWRVHPRTREFQVVAEGTSNPYGLAWDTQGSAIIEACHWANDHLFHFVETGHYQRQAGTFPPFTIPIGSITDHGHQKTAYCGIVNLDTDAYPPQFRERICVGNIHGGAINVDRLERDGATYIAKAEPDLLVANDAWFMPVALRIGPDGCLYILDWYDRYHCSQDAARDPEGVDRLKGRLYRLRYKDTPRASKVDLANESDDRLITRLSSPNIYFRETAQRILTERCSRRREEADLRHKVESMTLRSEKVRLLTSAATGDNRKARLHALWTLIGSGSLSTEIHMKLLAHEDASFRAWAVRAAGDSSEGSTIIRERITTLARDPSPDVQLQVVIASRKIKNFDAMPAISEVLEHCGHDKIIASIAWNNLHPLLETEAARFVSLQKQLSPAIAELSPRIVERILAAQRPDFLAVAAMIRFVAKRDELQARDCLAKLTEPSEELIAVLKELLAGKTDSPLHFSAQLLAARWGVEKIDPALIRARFTSRDQPEATRLQALDALIVFRDSALLPELPSVFSSNPPSFVTRVLATLGRVDDPKLADVLLAEYPKLAPELQPLVIDLIMQRERWARKLLDAVLANKVPKNVLNANHLRKILDSNDREALWAVEKAFGKIRVERNPEREKVVAEMGAYFREHTGDPQRGRTVFRNLCAQCHTIYGEGGKVGPDITANGRASFEQLLSNVFDPSLAIGPAYQVTTVVTRDDRNLTGLIAEDNEQRIVIRMPGGGEETVPRSNVKYTRVSKLSMMPEGLESALDKRDLADLFAFLSLDKLPTDAAAKLIPGAPMIGREGVPKP